MSERDWVVMGIVAISITAAWMEWHDFAIHSILTAAVLLLYWIRHSVEGLRDDLTEEGMGE